MLLLPILLLAVTVAWAAVAMIRDIAPPAVRALRRGRFDLCDLLLLVAVVGACLAVLRDNSVLCLPMLVLAVALSPLAWLFRFWLDDRRAAQQRVQKRKAAMQAPFRLPEPQTQRAPRMARRRLITRRPSSGPAMPLLTAYSLIARPLQ